MEHALRHRVAKRASISLTGQDLKDLAAITDSPAAASALSIDRSTSEAATLHRIFELGVLRAQELLDEAGYAELATDPEREAFKQASLARRRG
jgi:hypothetical protein